MIASPPQPPHYRSGLQSRQVPTREITDISFDDVLEAINPLRYIPVASSLSSYEPPSAIASMVGGALLGGPVGLAVAAINTVFEEATGSSLTQTAYQSLTGGDLPAPQTERYHTSFANAHKRHLHTWMHA